MKQAVIFDLDGTLWNSAKQCAESWTIALAKAGQKMEVTEADMYRFMGRTMEEISAMMLPKMSAEQRNSLMRLCTEEEQRYLKLHSGRLYPDVPETLNKLSKNYSLYIVSNSQDGYVQLFLENTGLGKYIEDYEMQGRTMLSKGENIRRVIERNAIDRAIYVGDTMGDFYAAEQADAEFVHARYGFGEVPQAVHFLMKFSDLPVTAQTIFYNLSNR